MTPTLRNKVANALSFAHLAGFGSRKAEGDEPEKKDGKAKGSRADDDEGEDKRDDQDHEDGDSKKSRKAEGDDPDKKDDDADAEGEDPDKKDDDSKAKGKKAKADDEDPDAEGDDDDEEMRGKSAAASARRRERARCAAIFASKAAARNPVLAANLAFTTSMTRKEALAVLEGTPAPAATGGDRSSRNPGLGAGGSSQPSSRQAVASSWDAAFAKANPRRK